MEDAKKTKHGASDRLMELPEAILQHIFSYLPMKDVIKTSVLAKRSRYVWLYVPCLNFPPMQRTAKREIAFISRSLLLHKSLEIDKLSIAVQMNNLEEEDRDSVSVESWVIFAATRNVKELRLIFSGFNPVIPQCVFKCESLTVLELNSCTIETPAKFQLSSLKSLSLEEISHGWEHANALLAASPNVERLSLINCCEIDSEKFDLFIMNLSLKTLKIEEDTYFYENRTMEVSAPFVINFDLRVSICNQKWVLTRMESLESVTLSCLASSEDYVKSNIVQILHTVCHVKDLTLCSGYIEAISTIAEQKLERSLSFSCTHLELKTELTMPEIAGIVFILKRSPNVQTLITSIEEIDEKETTPGGLDKILQKTGIRDVLKNLETIKVNDFMNNLSVRTKVRNLHDIIKNGSVRPKFKLVYYTTEELASQLEDDLSFLKFLLQNSPALKSMTVGVSKNLRLGQRKMTQLQLLTHEQLQAFPRASRNAVVSFRGN